MEFSPTHLAMILAVAAHLIVRGVQVLSRHMFRSQVRSETKLQTVTGFFSSFLVFTVYFGAIGFALRELGVPLTTYLASASVIGLAVSFGSQGVVQDIITGLTVVFSDLLDLGDMVQIGDQVGIVENVGIRFTVLVNFSGARVFVPNRSISNVINYPRGYIRAFLDVRLPSDASRWDEAERRMRILARASYEQYPGIILLPPTFEGRRTTAGDYGFLRFKFRIWPGQGNLLEGAVKDSAVQTMKALDESYTPWMVTVHYRAEPSDDDPGKRLPRPTALAVHRPRVDDQQPSRSPDPGD